MKLSSIAVTVTAFVLLAGGIPSVVSRQSQKPDAKVAMGYTIKRLRWATSATVAVDGRNIGSYIEFVAINDLGYIRDAGMSMAPDSTRHQATRLLRMRTARLP